MAQKLDIKPIPVTLLSGFLGSGKTTLLKHILTSPDHSLRVAIIVNDMAALNIDASLIKRHVVSQTQEKLIQLENGCICCTLRGDLLEELARLAKGGECDYVVIESTGISEPMQVAETFTEEFAVAMIEASQDGSMQGQKDDEKVLREIAELGGLNKVVKLDTLITVVDAFNFFQNFSTTEFITDRWGKEGVDPEDERTITDLMVDQIEFSNTVVVNKIESVDSKTRKRIRAVIQKLNPNAKIFESSYSRIDIKEVIATASFSFERAATGMGWLQSLHELSKREINGQIKIAPKPESEEYGISSFVYRARRPFHPKRLYGLIHDKFVLMEGVIEDEDGDEGDDQDDENDEWQDEDGSGDDEMTSLKDNEGSSQDSDADMEDDEDFSKSVDPKAVVKNKAAHLVFRGLLRSKGFYWLATRPGLHGEWSQAGTMLTLQGGGPWFAVADASQWPTDSEVISSIRADFSGPWGDRRQEIVFIAEHLDEAGLHAEFDTCLLTDKEMKKWEKIMKSSDDAGVVLEKLADEFEDGFEDWPDATMTEEKDDVRTDSFSYDKGANIEKTNKEPSKKQHQHQHEHNHSEAPGHTRGHTHGHSRTHKHKG